METFFADYKSLVYGISMAIGLLIFRKELNKLIDWAVSFKRLSKTKEGYSASVTPEASGATKPEDTTDKEQSVIKEAIQTETDQDRADNVWRAIFFEKDYDKASELLRVSIANQNDPKKRLEQQALLGYVLFEQDRRKGITYFKELLKTGNTASIVYNWYALSLFWDSDYAAAQSVIVAGIKACPDVQELQHLQSRVLHRQGNHDEAAEILMRAINCYPNEPRSYQALVQLLADIGMTEQAISCCQVGMSRCPQDADLIQKYVKILPEDEHNKKRDEHNKKRMVGYLRLTEIREENASYFTYLGNAYLQLGFHDLALEAYRKGNALAEEKEGWILGNIGNILNNQGFYSYGIEYFQRAVAINPNSQYSHDRLGDALKQAEDQKQERAKIREEVMKSVEAEHSLEDIVDQVKSNMAQKSHPNDSVKALLEGTLNEVSDA